ncbi:RES domain-containing protein [Saccharothrix saharensis]|uniref:RES domain-containing protein n=1 Tax=Saccharothrix saharensis TaxID=571190 RepID=UPI0036A31A8B
MLVYRVFPHVPSAPLGVPGHASYLHSSGQKLGRLDNPTHYNVWYLSYTSCGAIGETFGSQFTTWSNAMFDFPRLTGSKRALATYNVPDDLSILNLDDAQNLLDRSMRPTQVVERNRSATQAWALRIFNERDDHGHRKWQGVEWWSFHRPQWRILGLWAVSPRVVDVDDLDTKHHAVIDAAATLQKVII